MEVDRRNQNCYNYGEFGYLARNCRNRGGGNRIGDGRRLEYGQRLRSEENGQRLRSEENGQSNLNGKGDLVVLD